MMTSVLEQEEATECESHFRGEWFRRSDARRICGVGKDILDSWVADGKIEAHKLNAGKNGTVVFSAEDIRKAIRAAPLYKPRSFSSVAEE